MAEPTAEMGQSVEGVEEPRAEQSGENAKEQRLYNRLRSVSTAYFDSGAPSSHVTRWASEASFFDELAEEIAARLGPLDPLTVERYRNPQRSWSNKEFRFQLLGDLRGKRVLDVGCGEGTNAILMAKLGAHVTGVDLSSRSVDVCHRRALLDRVEDRTRFICAPVETVTLPQESFDVIWGDGVLHHVIPELEGVLRKLLLCAKPGALFIFSEPVSLAPLLRKLRKGIPIHTGATPDERPLEAAEMALIGRYLPGLRMRWFGLLSRLERFVLVSNNFERSSWTRKLMVDALWRLDHVLLSVPKLEHLGGMCVVHGHVTGR